MNMRYIVLFTLGFILSGCQYRDPVQQKNQIRHAAKKLTDQDFIWRNQEIVFVESDKPLTLKESVSQALQINPEFLAAFKQLGISKSELIQAGFFANPTLETIFDIPYNKGPDSPDVRTQIEVLLQFQLASFWLVPRRKKIAEDTLAITTREIIQMIIDINAQTKHAYAKCIYHYQKLALDKSILEKIIELKDQLYFRYQFGYATILDKRYADIRVTEWKNKIIAQEVALQDAYIALQKLMGTNPTNKPLCLETSFDQFDYAIEFGPPEPFVNYALAYHPQILIAHFQIKKAQDELSYERAHIFNDVRLGVSYATDFDVNTQGIGPSFGLSIPVFNANYGNIEAAKFRVEQTRKELRFQELERRFDVLFAYNNLMRSQRQLHNIETEIIPAIEEGLDYAWAYLHTMQLNYITLFNTIVSFYEYKLTRLEHIFDVVMNKIDLEKAVSTQLERILGLE